jgi:hypothetical protein
MSLVSELINYAAANLPTLKCALDFSTTDPETLVATSLEGSSPASVTFTGVEEVTSDGVVLTAGQKGNLSANFGLETITLIFIVIPDTHQSFTLYERDDTGGVYLTVDLLFPRLRYRSAYWGSFQQLDSTQPITANYPSVISFSMHTGTDSQTYNITHGMAGTETLYRDEKAIGRKSGQAITNGELFSAMDGVAAGFLVLGGAFSEVEIGEMLAQMNIYGQMLIPSNLDTGRFQSGVALKSDRTVDGTFSVPANESDIAYYSKSEKGTLLTFYAFEDNEAKSVLSAPEINLESTGSLYFSLIFGSNNEASQASKVSGIVQIDGTPAQRTVRAFGYDPTTHDLNATTVNLSKSLGHSTSDPETGDYTIELLGGYGKEIFVVAFDDYGAPFAPEATLAVGKRIHPTTPNGHVWECIGTGTLPAEEPAWVVDTESAQPFGTASMIARPFYRPMVHGPIMPEVTTLDPAP